MKPLSCPLQRKLLVGLSVCLLAAGSLAVNGCGGRTTKRDRPLSSLSEQDRAMLEQYETFRTALSQDDFRTAKRTAANLLKGTDGADASAPKPPNADILAKISNATGLEPQREAFRTWSAQVIALTKDVQGFYLVHSPLPGSGDWVQKDTKVGNPYTGKAMRELGEIKN